MRYAYYPGCSLHSTGSEYDQSFRTVCDKLGIELKEVPDWICCGTSPAHSTSRLLSLALPAKNLCQAEKTGLSEMVVPCASCFSRFKFAIHEMETDKAIAKEVSEIAGCTYRGKTRVIHPLETFSKLEPELAKGKTIRNLDGIRVACYYGCLLTRPPEVAQFDECEYPVTMDKSLGLFGIDTVDWSYKTECCGALFSLAGKEIVIKLAHDILSDAKSCGANCIAVACPLCHANLDTRQAQIEKKYGETMGVPILYFTQLIGLAMGIDSRKLALHKHLVSTDPVVRTAVASA